MFSRSFVLAAGCIALGLGCGEPADETQEIVGNLVSAGFPSNDIMVVDGKVYVGRDAEVSLDASREMLAASATPGEQYRTNNVVSPSLTKICINGSAFTGVFSTALDLAIQNYDELPLTFSMARTPSTGCSFTINAVIDPNMNGGVAGFPANGNPFGQITIGGLLSQYGVDVIEHVITHEIGHTIGFRHSDYYNRAISCGSGGNEGDAGVGAIHIPGTPTTASVGASIMNSCFRAVESGEFTDSDRTALAAMYTAASAPALVSALDPNRCLDVTGGSSAQGTATQLWECNGTAAQQWTLTAQGELRSSLAPNLCLDVFNGDPTPGTRVQIYGCNGTAAQRWTVVGATVRSALAPNLCLDVFNASTTPGTKIQVWGCNGTNAQNWSTR
ncbi:alpha-L-arabinofuranosidase [Corallococcus coralloides DSM 2259]|uniref:Alpha-L-arabinofuranosidase n=1 Tax=Corallococcus coralloides (strain ATCC 25202 / DSM 2259 / NBRC 100086 / M2) TaxID=1144275 RepID=H8N0Z2_CORCM|nr:M57 family metalloprotease [Corallococcus coralloides]AFE07938.1 alpha-L-arabinofuranosidase [Corallococcus coralloides DSM 2259]